MWTVPLLGPQGCLPLLLWGNRVSVLMSGQAWPQAGQSQAETPRLREGGRLGLEGTGGLSQCPGPRVPSVWAQSPSQSPGETPWKGILETRMALSHSMGLFRGGTTRALVSPRGWGGASPVPIHSSSPEQMPAGVGRRHSPCPGAPPPVLGTCRHAGSGSCSRGDSRPQGQARALPRKEP